MHLFPIKIAIICELDNDRYPVSNSPIIYGYILVSGFNPSEKYESQLG
jgi:hypothetical protein